ncbi:biotin transporter BioY [Quadrisphaera sp. DSM 44207]|uniref:biotin transporter BioY n=1 Tax=Quadrisphaera sp. DSM 44207 TaxID=1881057 RepID=UPI0008827FC8|nr:biotin transporter BioY [Quadrisphaera sp. DSM 44207]SDQ48182.1 biotin transport system substrate-specific component [Quadrisphaera sp. DSM 44207]
MSRTAPRRTPARDLALIAVFAALIAALGLPGAFPVPGLPVPITLQTFGVMLAGALLGARRGALAVLVLLALVVAGLPLLAGGRGGLAVLAGPSAGYLLGWPVGAFVIGALLARRPARGAFWWTLVACVVGGIGVVYAFGIPVLAARTDVPLATAAAGNAVFLPGDLLKAALAAAIAVAVHRGYPVLDPRADAASARGRAGRA